MRCAVVALAALLLAAGAAAQSAPAPTTGLSNDVGFIRVIGQNFADDQCNQFVFSGYNTWQPIEQAAGLNGGLAGLEEQFDNAVANNLTVIRAFGYVVQQGWNLQESTGIYNNSLLVAFDNVIAAASARGLKLTVALANNWNYNSNSSDTKTWYAEEFGYDDPDAFWTAPEVIQAYKEHAAFILSRRNTVTGITYGNDPTIFSWNLINEGRCETTNCTAADIQSWIGSVAPYVRGLTNSLLTVGSEGFYQASNCQANYVNPVPNSQEWCLETGQDFVANHFLEAIDYTGAHMWSDNWGRTDVPFAEGWLLAHMEDSATINKPMVLEEFGKADGPYSTSGNTYGNGTTLADQTAYYKLVYSYAESSIDNGGSLKGVSFWRWNAISGVEDLDAQDAALTLNTSSTTFQQVVLPFSGRIAELSLSKIKVPGCTNINSQAQVGAPVGSQTPATTSASAVSAAGRKLLQTNGVFAAAAPSALAGVTPATVDSLITNCSAYYPYSLQAQTGAPGPSRR